MDIIKEQSSVVQITLFYNPEIFWIIYESDIPLREDFINGINNFTRCSRPKRVKKDHTYLVKYEENLVRAEIIDIRKYDSPVQHFVCWLVDFGVFIEATDVYSLPKSFAAQPPFAKRAILYGLKSISKEKSEADWPPGIQKFVIEKIAESDPEQRFIKKYLFGNTVIGNVYLSHPKKGLWDLNEQICRLGLAKYDEQHTMASMLDAAAGPDQKIDMEKIYSGIKNVSFEALRVQQHKFSGRGKKIPNTQLSVQAWVDKSSALPSTLSTTETIDHDFIYDDDSQNSSSVSGKQEKLPQLPIPKGRSKLLDMALFGKEPKIGIDSTITDNNDFSTIENDGSNESSSRFSDELDCENNTQNESAALDNEVKTPTGQNVSKNLAETSIDNSWNDLEDIKKFGDCVPMSSTLITKGRGFARKSFETQTENKSFVSTTSFDDAEIFSPNLNSSGRGFSKNITPPGKTKTKSSKRETIDISALKSKDKNNFDESQNVMKSIGSPEFSSTVQLSAVDELETANSTENGFFDDASDSISLKSSGRGFAKNISPKSDELETANSTENGFFDDAESDSVSLKSSGRGFAKNISPKSDELETANPTENGFFDDAESDSVSLKSSGRGFAKNISPKSVTTKQKSSTDLLTSTSSLSEIKEDQYFEDAFGGNSPPPFVKNRVKVDIVNAHPAGSTLASKASKTNSKTSSSSSSNDSTDNKLNKPNTSTQNFRSLVNSKRPPDNLETDQEDRSPFCSENLENSNEAPKLITGRCLCDTCETWRMDKNVVFKPVEVPERKPKTKIVQKPQPLFKPGDGGEVLEKIKVNKEFQNEIDKLTAPRLLVHGYFVPKPIEDLCEVPFHPFVHRNMRNLCYEKAYRIQTYAWPSIMRGHHVFVVGGPESGKTMVYIPALSTFVMSSNDELPQETGPVAVVICPGVKVAETVYKLFQKFIDPRSKKTVKLALMPMDRKDKRSLSQGTDILVCTLHSLYNILKDKTLKLKRLCHIVIECANVLFGQYSAEMESLLGLLERTLNARTFLQAIQCIVVSQEWSQHLEVLSKRLNPVPLICIGAYLEAALYGRVKISIQFIESSAKPFQAIELIKQKSKYFKTVIVCNENEDSKSLLEYLDTNGIENEYLGNDSTIEDIKYIGKRWSTAVGGKYFVLISTDEILNTGLMIVDASIMIQYSLPTSWSQFAFRFSLFNDNYWSPLAKDKHEEQLCKMHIFLDESNTEQFPKIIQFLKRMQCTVSPKMLEYYDSTIQACEERKLTNKVELCNNLITFGECLQMETTCEKRHILSSILDVSQTLPQSGLIKLKALYISDVTTLYARLIEYTDADGVVHPIEDKFAEIAARLIKYTSDLLRHVLPNLSPGVFGIVEETAGIYRRCEIIRTHKKKLSSESYNVDLRLIDTGSFLSVLSSKIYMLPDELKNIPAQAIKIQIANLGPPYRDTTWSEHALQMITKEYKAAGYELSNCYFTGRIKLQLKNTIFVDNLILQEHLDNDKLLVHRLSVRETVFQHSIAQNRPNHLNSLYKLCEKYDIILPDYSLPVVKTVETIKAQQTPMWAHLENGRDYSMVYFCTAYSPDHFYVRLCENQSLFNSLNKDIEHAMGQPFYPKKFRVLEGRCYLAKDPQGDTYARALVTKLTDSLAECFFVDFGDTAQVPVTELKFLPDELIRKLPFQAIECKLWGIEPAGQKWLSEATDILYDVAFEPETDLLRFLHVKYMTTENAEITGFKKYSIIMIDTLLANTIVNNLFINLGFAVQLTEKLIEVDFEAIVAQTNNNNSDSDENTEYDGNNEINGLGNMENDAELDEWDLQINNPDEFFGSLFNKKFEPVRNNENGELCQQNREEPKMHTIKALPAPGYSTPKVIWQQTNTHVTIRIQTVDAVDYEICVLRKRKLFFKTEINDITYRLDLNLYEKVDPEIEHSCFGLYILVKLKKLEEIEWPRLVLTKERLRHITYNVAIIPDDDDSDEEVKRILKRQKSNANIDDDENGPYIYEFGSDEDYDQSDIESDHGSDDS